MVAFADGLNFYLHTHPEVKPKLLTHFEPWMALAFSEGSIGGDIESIDLKQLEKMYGKRRCRSRWPTAAPASIRSRAARTALRSRRSCSASGHALLLINPHTSFYFRPEVHMVSEEGLNAYGAVTWGQFFVYQGFNERAGWMHTSGGGDVIDEYLETVVEKDGKFFYQYGGGAAPDARGADHAALQDGRAGWPARPSPRTSPTTARWCARPAANGSRSS